MIGVLGALALAPAAHAQSLVDVNDPEDAAVILSLVDQLDDEAYRARERATRTLAALDGAVEALILDTLGVDALSPEQLVRLESAFREKFYRTPRAAIGVQFSNNFNSRGLILESVFEPFDASRVLRRNDEIVGIDDVNLLTMGLTANAREWLRSYVFAHDPGDAVKLRIRRLTEHNALMDVEVRLGTTQAFPQDQQRLERSSLDAAWDMRRKLLGIALGPETDILPEGMPEPEIARIDTGPRFYLRRAGAMAGGAPRSDPTAYTQAIAGEQLATRLPTRRETAKQADAARPLASKPERVSAIDEELRILAQRRRELNAASRDPRVNEAQRVLAEEKLRLLELKIIQLEGERNRLNEQQD